MLERYNFTPFVAATYVMPDAEGRECLVALLKATWSYSDTGEIGALEREEMLPIVAVDEYHEDADDSSVRYPADLVVDKKGTDVVVNGHVYGNGRTVIDAGFRLGNLTKTIRCFGARQWQRDGASMRPGPVERFTRIPLRYEYAYGGRHAAADGTLDAYEPNPIGMGYAPNKSLARTMPHLEYANQPVQILSDRPAPASLGALPPHWPQRRGFTGTYDQHWERTRRPLLPADFDVRFNNSVPPDQILEDKLKGGEQLVLHNLHPRAGVLSLAVPPLAFEVTVRVNHRSETKPMEADTLLVEPDQNRLSVTLRSSFPVNNQYLQIKTVHFRRRSD